jgi:polyisoprenoid-binding protein YceI
MKEKPLHATSSLPEEETVHHVIDASQSSFFVQVFATGLLSAFGHNPKIAVRDFRGDVFFATGNDPLARARLSIHVRADSLECVDDISAKDREDIHRRIRDEVLETDSFPEIAYECSRVSASRGGDRFWAALTGALTLHGVTIGLPISAFVSMKDNTLRASGEFTLRQSDYGIATVTAAAGTIRVKDEVKCSYDIVARRQES